MPILRLLSLILLIGLSSNVSAQSACGDGKYQTFGTIIGKWIEFDSDNKQIGSLETRKITNGCALHISHKSISDNYSSESFLYIDTDGVWKEIEVDSNGVVNKYRWAQNEEEVIIEQIEKAGPGKQRFVISDISDTEYKLQDERSSDWGQSWSSFMKIKRIREINKTIDSED